MLCELKIANLALIDSAHLVLDSQAMESLVVMTGETGAGKSIMLQAIALLTGRRASADWIRAGEQSCTVEALFELDETYLNVRRLLEDGGFGNDTTIIIKRVINRKGKSRIYVNGSLATARFVGELGSYLINIASQHDHQQLLQPSKHLDFLDTLGDTWDQRRSVSARFEQWQQARTALSDLQSRARDREQRIDFLSYQLKEIGGINPAVDEDEALDKERRRLKSGDSLMKLSREVLKVLNDRVINDLSHIRKQMDQLADLDPDLRELAAEIGEYSYVAEEYSTKIRSYSDHLEIDPFKLEAINERISEIQGLKRKYGETIADILHFRKEAEQELQQIENLEQEIDDQKQVIADIESDLVAQATQLSKERQQTAAVLQRGMAAELSALAFNEASVEVMFEDQAADPSQLRATGFDRVEFLFTANPGEPAYPLAKIASGGELSRLMLAMKCLLAQKDMVKTIIFDEVDAGIGGEAAEAVARKIKELSGHHQVICITHLPQIAARGTAHLKVDKTIVAGRTLSKVRTLTEKERVAELARMLAGASPTAQTQAWAHELLTKGKEAA